MRLRFISFINVVVVDSNDQINQMVTLGDIFSLY